jgi:drug/metabolite transporter (DMT)-like permease
MPEDQNKRLERRSALWLLAITGFWGLTFPVTKDALRFIPAVYFIFIRFTLASLFVYIIFHKRIRQDRFRSFLPGLIVAITIFLGFITQTVGLNYTSANKSAFITSMYVVFVPFISFFLEKRRLSFWPAIGILLAVAGLYFLARPTAAGFNLGDILTLTCAFAFAFQIVLTNIYTRRHDGSLLLFYEFAAAAVLCIPFLWVKTDTAVVINRQLIFAITYISLVATVFNIFIQNKFQKNVLTTKAALIYATEPIFASVFAYLFLGEFFTRSGLLGAGLIIAGLFVSELG